MVANQPPPIAFRVGHCCSRSYSSVLGAARCYVSHCNGAVPCPPPRRENTTQGSVLGKGDSTCSVRRLVAFPNRLSFPCWFPVRARGPRTACHAGADYFVFVKGFWTAVQTPRYVVGRMWSVTWLAPRLHSHHYHRSIASHQSHTSPCAPRTPAPPLYCLPNRRTRVGIA